MGTAQVIELRPTPAVADFHVRDAGSIVQLVVNTDAAWEWLDEWVAYEQWQWLGNALCVEPRYLEDLVVEIIANGLTVEPL